MIRTIAFLVALLYGAPAFAATCGAYPYTLTNGTTADATQVMSDFDTVRNCVVNNAASIGANNDITSLTGLSTPLPIAEGGTGVTAVGWPVKISRTDVSATASVALSLTGSYLQYEIHMVDVTAADAGPVYVYGQFSADNCVTPIAANYRTSVIFSQEGTNAADGSGAANQIFLSSSSLASAGGPYDGRFIIPDPLSAANNKRIYGSFHVMQATPRDTVGQASGYYAATTAAVNCLKVFMSTGNIAGGSFEVWGVP